MTTPAPASPGRQYARYVYLHKLYVYRWMMALGRPAHIHPIRWWWRALVHDLSKFSKLEWTAYRDSFYGTKHAPDAPEAKALASRFNHAWLHHLHANPHHWQHWMLRQDDGKTLTLLMPAECAVEMLADWLSAGPKVLRRPSMEECVAETVVWYMKTRHLMSLRQPTREYIEQQLHALAQQMGLLTLAREVKHATDSRVQLTIPGRETMPHG